MICFCCYTALTQLLLLGHARQNRLNPFCPPQASLVCLLSVRYSSVLIVKMENSWSTLLCLPNDVLIRHIILQLGWSTLVSCFFVCSKLRRIVNLHPSINRKTRLRVLKDLFHNGNLTLFSWFQKVLGFPTFSCLQGELLTQCMGLAVSGMQCKILNINFLLIKVFLTSWSLRLSQCGQQARMCSAH